jgi:L-lactate dehydrogenase complex protein LldG
MTSDAGLDRAAFVARIRRALEREGGAAPAADADQPPPIPDDLVRVGPAADGAATVDLFAAKAEEAGMGVARCGRDDLAATLASILRERGVERLTTSVRDAELAAAIETAAGDLPAEVVDWRPAPGITAHFDVHAGVTDVVAAIAESGTLVLAASADHSRGTHIVPPLHVALVRADDVVPDMLDFWPRRADVAPADLPSYTVLVTGPSKTGDIESILVTGVHGPREVRVIIVG